MIESQNILKKKKQKKHTRPKNIYGMIPYIKLYLRKSNLTN